MITFYRRPACGLCDEGREALQAVLEERAAAGRTPCRIEEREIDGDPDLEQRYGETIPVLAVGMDELPLATSGWRIRTFLARTLDRGLA
jgi:hypothetical protein